MWWYMIVINCTSHSREFLNITITVRSLGSAKKDSWERIVQMPSYISVAQADAKCLCGIRTMNPLLPSQTAVPFRQNQLVSVTSVQDLFMLVDTRERLPVFSIAYSTFVYHCSLLYTFLFVLVRIRIYVFGLDVNTYSAWAKETHSESGDSFLPPPRQELSERKSMYLNGPKLPRFHIPLL